MQDTKMIKAAMSRFYHFKLFICDEGANYWSGIAKFLLPLRGHQSRKLYAVIF